MTALDTAVPKRRPRIGATISDRVRGLGLKLPALQAIWVKERSHPVLVKGAAFFALGARS